jgi:hypothetical protein
VSPPSPALVTERGARRLPRVPLLLLCAAYVLPGVFGRDPWRNADLAAYGLMAAMAEGRTSWLAPTLGGVAADTALLPHWLGAVAVASLGPWLGGPLAARLPFALLLAATLMLTWYACYHLARTEAAQPVAFAFGGEAQPVDYARAIADAAVLALIATLGLLQLGHETTPELVQLAAVAALLWALAAAPFRPRGARAVLLLALPALAAAGAPTMAVLMGGGAWLVCARSSDDDVRPLARWVAAATLLAAAIAALAGSWRWRAAAGWSTADAWSIGRQWAWFLWPVWPAVLWTLWRWRRHLQHRHVSVPLVVALVALAANLAMRGADRALLLALPATAILAAFALPTLRRSASAAIDWFSMLFFSASALVIWVIYAAMHTGMPAKPAANVAKLAPAFVPGFGAIDLLAALLATLAWLWLVRWRSGRHREAVWKSMVLPAAGVALTWLLLMTLWRPLLDHARSAEPWVDALRPPLAALPASAARDDTADCLAAPGLAPALVAALEVHGGWRVEAGDGATACGWRVTVQRGQARDAVPAPPGPGWQLQASLRRPTDREELTAVWRRQAPAP